MHTLYALCTPPTIQVRGATSPPEELAYIARHSDSVGLIVQDAATLDALVPLLHLAHGTPHPERPTALRFVVLLRGEPSEDAGSLDVPVLTFDQVNALGETRVFSPTLPSSDDLATLVFTSGTTGNPKVGY